MVWDEPKQKIYFAIANYFSNRRVVMRWQYPCMGAGCAQSQP